MRHVLWALTIGVVTANTVLESQDGIPVANIGQKIKDDAFKVSPQDRSGGSAAVDQPEKFTPPKKASLAGNVAVEGDTAPADAKINAEKGSKGAVILDDYDPTRIGVSADEASEVKKKQGKGEAEVKSAFSSSADSRSASISLSLSSARSALSSASSSISTSASSAPGLVSATSVPTAVPSETTLISKSTTNTLNPKETSKSKDSKIVTEVAGREKSPEDMVDKQQTSATSEEGRSFGRVLGVMAMIVVSELGDKTFFIAALMSMRHSPLFVFTASYFSLAIMTVLSIFLGMVLPSLLSKQLTTLLASVLFLVFGIRLVREGWVMEGGSAETMEELHEVEVELDMTESNGAYEKAEQGGVAGPDHTSSHGQLREFATGLKNLASLIFSPLWIQIFAMTFLAEWGDRSQVATVALGAGSYYIEVLIGTLVGHALCTIIAIVGGKFLATRLSARTITLVGGLCFLAFAVVYFSDWVGNR